MPKSFDLVAIRITFYSKIEQKKGSIRALSLHAILSPKVLEKSNQMRQAKTKKSKGLLRREKSNRKEVTMRSNGVSEVLNSN